MGREARQQGAECGSSAGLCGVPPTPVTLLQSQPGPRSAGDPRRQHALRMGRLVELNYLRVFNSLLAG